MSFNSENNALKTILEIFNQLFKNEKIVDNKIILLNISNFIPSELISNKNNLSIKELNVNIENRTLESKDFYLMHLSEYASLILKGIKIELNSYYSFLYFMRIINYLNILISSNNNIIENKKIKIFFELFLIFLKKDKENYEKEDLNEAFFVGTFKELKKSYSNNLYKDSSLIEDTLKRWKKEYNKKLLNMIEITFSNIKNILKENTNPSDTSILKMKEIVNEIEGKVFNIYFKQIEDPYINDINNLGDLLDKVKNFYSNEEYLLFTNYCSEIIKSGEELEKEIDLKSLQKKENKSKYLKAYFTPDNTQNDINKLDSYKTYKKKMNYRMYLSSFKKFFDMNLNNEILICTILMENFRLGANNSLDLIENTENNVENLDNDEISEMIEDILNDNEFYKLFFLILKTDIVKKFFTNILYLDENGEEYNFVDSNIENSECFKNIYEKFMKYDDEDNSFQDFKNLIIIKTLSKGDRACVITKLKKIIINPSQFFIGKKIEKNAIKEIIKGYLLVILLHETEHFLRLLNEEKDVFNRTPRNKEGGRLFIKYIFGVESISHIDESQAKKLLNINNWKDHSIIKVIFDGQKENRDIDKYFQEIYPNSISFYSSKILDNIDDKEYKDEYAPLKK